METDVAEEEDVAGTEDALSRPSRPTTGSGLGYTCDVTSRQCTCDKSIEDDCAYMSGVCTDASIDKLIECIKGWGTSHCTCTMARVAPPKPTLPPTTHAPIGSTGSTAGIAR